MCGIFGWAARARNCPGEARLVALTNLLSHRGPDGHGAKLFRTSDELFSIGLGHRRLSVVDLSDASSQPMWSADGTCCLTYNGEIYNYLELRVELEASGRRFKTTGDTEVLIAALQAWGPQAIPRLRGMFAFAFYDTSDDSLLLARDAFGKKPLFLGHREGDLFFSSEIEPILQSPGFASTFNPSALDGYLLDRYVPGPETFFRQIDKLSPGCWGIWRAGEWSVHRYFTPPLAHTVPDFDDYGKAIAAFAEGLEEAVRIRMRSDAPFGAFLSGGLDSSAIVAIMARHTAQPVRTFSVGFNEEQYSELKFARLAAERFETQHEETIVTPEQFFELWPEAVKMRGAPVTEASDIPILILARSAAKSVKVVLTGEGADEILAGYPKYLAEYYTGPYQKFMPQSVRDRLVAPLVDRLPYGMRRIKVLAKSLGQRNIVDRVRIWFGGLSVQERNALLNRETSQVFSDPFPFSIGDVSMLRKAQFFDQTSYLPDNALERGDRMMMAGSIEGRMPFMDVELAALAARMPDRFLIRRGVGKAILRDAMKTLLPSVLCNRKKNGFRVPIDHWFRNGQKEVVHDLLSSARSRTRQVLNAALIDRFVVEHMEGRANQERILWSLCNLEQFLRVFDIDAEQVKEALAQ